MNPPRGEGKQKRGRPVVVHRTPDRDWFRAQLEAAGYSQNEIGRQLGKSASLITRGLKGERAITIEEAIMFARLLHKPIDVILRHAGYSEVATPSVPIVGKVLGDGSISNVTARKGPFPAAGYPDNAVAFVADTEGSPLAPYHGAVFIVSEAPGPFLDAFGRLCIIEADDHKNPLLGTLGKAASRGAGAFTLFGSGEVVPIAKPLRALIVCGIVFP